MAKTKGELCIAAFRKAKISGITSTPTGDELAGACETLEDMMRELISKNAVTTYAYEDSPSLSTDSNLDPKWYHAVQSRLAVLLCNDYGLDPSQSLMAQARQGWSSMIGKLTIPVQNGQPNRMPRGSGNTYRFPTWTRFYYTHPRAPISSDTLQLKIEETTSFTVGFEEYLTPTETIASYVIEDATGGVTLNSDSSTDTEVTFNVTGVESGSQSLVIKITTNIGRVYPLKVWFSVSEV